MEFNDKHPIAYILKFEIRNYDPITVKIIEHSFIDENSIVNVPVMMLGEFSVANTYLNSKVNDPDNQMGLDQMIPEAIRIQSLITPEKVGMPVDLVFLTKNGPTWLFQKEGCPVVLD